MLQCSLLVEKYCSNSNLKNGDGEAVGVSFWGVFSLKLVLKKPLEMLSEKIEEREREKEHITERVGEKAGGDQVSLEGQSWRRSAFTKQQRLLTPRLGQIGLTFFFFSLFSCFDSTLLL